MWSWGPRIHLVIPHLPDALWLRRMLTAYFSRLHPLCSRLHSSLRLRWTPIALLVVPLAGTHLTTDANGNRTSLPTLSGWRPPGCAALIQRRLFHLCPTGRELQNLPKPGAHPTFTPPPFVTSGAASSVVHALQRSSPRAEWRSDLHLRCK